MGTAETPQLLYFTLTEKRSKGHALISKLCGFVNCGSPLGYVDKHGLTLSGKHSKDRVDKGTLTANDLRALADFIDSLGENCSTMEADRAA